MRDLPKALLVALNGRMSKSFQISRRSFLTRCSTIAAATGLPLWFVRVVEATAQQPASSLSASSRRGVALVGCGGMGRADGSAPSKFCDIFAVCDVDRSHAGKAVEELSQDGKPAPMIYKDFREALARDDVHVIVQATPDHWHTLINIAAAKAGKDVYAEKPLTLTIDEGKRTIKAVRENKIVLQTGTQQRSSTRFHLACELVRNGRIGTLKQVNVFVPAGLRAGLFPSPQTPPEGFDWDFWLGQAPQVPYLKERCHGNFRWWYDYSGGPVTDWGAHHNDIARWGIGSDGPTKIEARALVEPIPGGYTVPSEFEATLTWPNGVTQIVRTTPDDSPYGAVIKEDGQRNGIKFTGTGGWIWVNRDEITANDPEFLRTPLPEDKIKLAVSRNHMGNFFECVQSRQDPVSNVETGHRSACVGHLIVIALRTGKTFEWDPRREVFTGRNASTGNAFLARQMRAPYDYSFIS